MPDDRFSVGETSIGIEISGNDDRIWVVLTEGVEILVLWRKGDGYYDRKKMERTCVSEYKIRRRIHQAKQVNGQLRSLKNLLWNLLGSFGEDLWEIGNFLSLFEGKITEDMENHLRQLNGNLGRQDLRKKHQWISKENQDLSSILNLWIGEMRQTDFEKKDKRKSRLLEIFPNQWIMSALWVIGEKIVVKDNIAGEIWVWSKGSTLHRSYFGRFESSITCSDYVRIDILEIDSSCWFRRITEEGKRKVSRVVLLFKGENRMLVKALVSPRKGVQVKGKGKEGKGKERKSVAETNRQRVALGKVNQTHEFA